MMCLISVGFASPLGILFFLSSFFVVWFLCKFLGGCPNSYQIFLMHVDFFYIVRKDDFIRYFY